MTEQANLHQQIIAKCWADDAFKQRLLADPAGVLKQEGVKIPAGVSIHVVENTDTSAYWVIPARPSALRDDELQGSAAVGGGVWIIVGYGLGAGSSRTRRKKEWGRP